MGTVIGPNFGRFCHWVIVIISDKHCIHIDSPYQRRCVPFLAFAGESDRPKMVAVPKNLGKWKWKLRTDLDVLQRCLTVALLAHLAYNAVNAVRVIQGGSRLVCLVLYPLILARMDLS